MRLLPVSALALALMSCGAPSSGVRQFVGPVGGGSDVVIGLVHRGTSIALYSCGGASTYATESRWFTGTTDVNGAFSLTKDGWTASGIVTNDIVSGNLKSPSGVVTPWSVDVYTANDGGGLYEVVATGGCMTGVVVWSSGGALTTQGTWCDGSGYFDQVIPVQPSVVNIYGFPIQVNTPAGTKSFNVIPASILVGG